MQSLKTQKNTRFWFWLLPLLLLTIIRVYLPAIAGETLVIHSTIASSILEGNKWGQLALVKIIDVPLLPTLAMVAAKIFTDPLQLNAAAVICGLSQATALLVLLSTFKPHRFTIYGVVAVLAMCMVPLFRSFLLVNDPNWIAAIPLAFAVRIIVRWHDDPDLKYIIALASLMALLIFCGPIMALAALIILIVFTLAVGKTLPQGGYAILWMPFIYALILWLPWYSPTHDNFIVQTLDNLKKRQPGSFAPTFAVHTLYAFGVALLILILKTKENLAPRCLLPLLIMLPFATAIASAANFSPAACGALLCIITAATAIQAFNAAVTNWKTPQIAACLAVITAVSLAITHADVRHQTRDLPELIKREKKLVEPPPDLFDFHDAPTAQQLAEAADAEWKGSRIVVIGKRMTTVYPDKHQDRFIPREKFDAEAFRTFAKTEQIHLLVPPDDARFYEHDSILADIHRNGAPYLFLVKNFPDNWQLWRSIPAPEPKK